MVTELGLQTIISVFDFGWELNISVLLPNKVKLRKWELEMIYEPSLLTFISGEVLH